jgi:F-type H+-transporting ATPase subunit delta
MEQPSAKEFHDKADVSARRIARVYAESLLNAAKNQGQEDEALAELDVLVRDIFPTQPRLETLLSSAALGRKARHDVIQTLFASRTTAAFTNFLQVLNDHERLDLLRPILTEAHALFDQRHGRLQVLVTSAVPLLDEVRRRLETSVRDYFHLEPVLKARVDPEVLGGLKVRIGDMLYDASVRSKLDNLRNQILASSSHEIQSRRDRFSN